MQTIQTAGARTSTPLLSLFLMIFFTSLVFSQEEVDKKVFTVLENPPLPLIDTKKELYLAKKKLSSIRKLAGVLPFKPSQELQEAAQMHANFIVLNHTPSHSEVSTGKQFSGESPADRAFAAGFASSYVLENLSAGTPSAESSLEGLFSAIYHRFSFLNLSINEIGIGIAQSRSVRSESAFVYVMGSSYLNSLCYFKEGKTSGRFVTGSCTKKKHLISESKFKYAKEKSSKRNSDIVVYPYNHQKNVGVAFYNEIPDPRPNNAVSGIPVSLEFNEAFLSDAKISSFELFRGREKVEVDMFDLSNDPHQKLSTLQFAIFPKKPLLFGTTYYVEVSYTSRGRTHQKHWSFSTKTPKNLHILKGEASKVSLRKGVTHTLYFPPANPHDVISSVIAPRSVFTIELIDGNTVLVRPNKGSSGIHTLSINNRKVTVLIK